MQNILYLILKIAIYMKLNEILKLLNEENIQNIYADSRSL